MVFDCFVFWSLVLELLGSNFLGKIRGGKVLEFYDGCGKIVVGEFLIG